VIDKRLDRKSSPYGISGEGAIVYILTWVLSDAAFASTMKRTSITNNVYVLSFVATVGIDILEICI